MAAEAGEEAHLGVDDVARLRVATRPDGQEAHLFEAGNPLGEDLGDYLQKLLAVVLDVLASLVGVGVGTGAADDLTRVGELLAVDGAESFVVTTVDNHVQCVAVHAHQRQPTRNEGLVLHGVEARVDAQHVGETLGSPAHGVDKVLAVVFHVLALVGAHQGQRAATVDALHVQQLAVLVHTTAEALADATDVVYHAARRSLPAVARHQGVAVGRLAVVPQGRYLPFEVLAVHHVGVAPGAAGVEGFVCCLVVHQVHIARRFVVDVVYRLYLLEYLMTVLCDVGNVRIAECRTSTADVAPRGSAAPVDQHGVEARLAEVAEQSAARDAATSDEHPHPLAMHLVALREDEDLLAALGVEVAQGHLIAQRRTRRGVASKLDAVRAQQLPCTGNAALAAAGAHTHAGDVLQLVDGDVLAVAHGLQHLPVGDVLAVADVGGFRVAG